MCTMTWFTTDQGYQLFFNRDESLLRAHADLPTIQAQNDIAYISPTDTDAGGTWIAANQLGITVCLLNHYQFEQIATYKNWISRGEVVRQFADTADLLSAQEQFNAMCLDDYRAFRMFIIERSGKNLLCVWDGHTARIEHNVQSPKSSSSVDAQHVKKLRRELFASRQLPSSKSSADYLHFHASHFPKKSADSVCVHRKDAKTVSLSHVSVSAELVAFAYADGSPCQAELVHCASLPILGSGDLTTSVSLTAAVANR